MEYAASPVGPFMSKRILSPLVLRTMSDPASPGQRLYRKKDLELVLRIKTLLYDERLTLEGAKKRLRGEARGTIQMDLGLKSVTLETALRRTRDRLRARLRRYAREPAAWFEVKAPLPGE